MLRKYQQQLSVLQENSVRSERTHTIVSQTFTNNPETTTEEKLKSTKRVLATVYAFCYAIFLVVLSLILFIGTNFKNIYPIYLVSLFDRAINNQKD